MATSKATEKRLYFLYFLATIRVVDDVSTDIRGFQDEIKATISCISMWESLSHRDEAVS